MRSHFLQFLLLLLALLPFPAHAANANEDLLAKIVERAAATGSDSLVIEQHGRTVYENFYGKPDRVRSVQSVSKSVVALAIGTLLDEGRISSLDLPMSTWIPAWAAHPEKSKITLRMILNHTSGLPDNMPHKEDPPGTVHFPDFFQAPDVVAAAANTALITPPGSRFLYSNIGASLVQPVIAQAAGEALAIYVRRKLFAPMGIADASWTSDKMGQERTSGGLNMSTASLLKLGRLMLRKGMFGEKEIVSTRSFALLTTPSQEFRAYGLLWWLYGEAESGQYPVVSAKGWGGQFITVYPEKNLIAVRTRDPATVDLGLVDFQKFPAFPHLIAQWE